MDKKTQSLINKYNKSVDSIKSQELAIEKVKQQLEGIQNGSVVPTSLRELNTQLAQNQKELDKVTNKINQLSHKKVKTSVDEAELQRLQQAQVDLKQIISEIETEMSVTRGASVEVQQLTSKLENMNSKLSQTKDEANQTKNQVKEMLNQKNNILGGSIDEINKKIGKFGKRLTSLMSAQLVFNVLSRGITSLKNSLSKMLKTDNQFSSSLNQIKANLMVAFAPIYNAVLPAINSLMSALSRVTGTIATFVSNLFGKSLSDSTKQAKELSNALGDTAKSGDEANGSLSSIDKLEVIGGNNESSVGGKSNTGIDYSGDIQISQRLLDFLNAIKDFVVNNKELILGLFAGIISALALMKLGIDKIMALGIGLIIGGIVTLIQGIIDFIKDPSWENFGTILTGLSMILAGVAVAMLAVNAANPVAWIMLAIAAVVALGAVVIKNWDKIKEILGQVGSWIYNNIIVPVGNFFSGLWNGIVNGATNAWNLLVSGASWAWNGIKSVFSTVVSFFKNIFTNAWTAVKNVFSVGGKIFDGIKEGIVDAFKAVVNVLIRGINKVVAAPFNGLNGILNKIQKIGFLGIEPFKWLSWRAPVPKIPELAKGTVIPPRQKFMAILGDQKHGTNIEAPLETIKQANREVLQEFMGALMGLNNNEREIVFKNLTIVAQFGHKDFTKLVVEAVRLAEKELGKPLFVS